MTQYRIVQVGDRAFAVEQLWLRSIVYGIWWWAKAETVEEWLPIGRCPCLPGSGIPSPPAFPSFATEAAAQKWIDDKRKYPMVVKEPA